MLRRRVDRQHRVADQSENRRHVDDDPRPTLEHGWKDRPGAQEGTEKVGVHDRSEVVERLIDEEGFALDRGVVHEDVDASGLLEDLGDHLADAGLIADVADDRRDLPGGPGEGRGGGLRPPIPIDDEDPGAGAGVCGGDRLTDPARTARDDRHAAIQTSHPRPPRCPAIPDRS